ncbi:cobalamin biosynthesis protein [Nocardia blacklockiae]|uniref:cobalamin biosynthesis protein n=1 Tax=Nocardia blacklockiae TaxID=480036 RepID=UPI002B4B8340|nr:cobalamin biosynthesis protein [Nocardia blacklockiae]
MPDDELAVGVGFRPGTPAAAIVSAVREVFSDSVIRCLATVDRRAGDPELIAAADELGASVVYFSAERLAQIEVPNPAARTTTAVGTPSVAEAAALCAAKSTSLAVPKRVLHGVTIAAARYCS